MNATPRPWHTRRTSLRPALIIARVYESGIETEAAETVEQATANVELIIRAVNSFDAMREALEGLLNTTELNAEELEGYTVEKLKKALAALALAKGER